MYGPVVNKNSLERILMLFFDRLCDSHCWIMLYFFACRSTMAGVPGQGFTPGTAAAPYSQVEISISCRFVHLLLDCGKVKVHLVA